jgi:hypothetical protein
MLDGALAKTPQSKPRPDRVLPSAGKGKPETQNNIFETRLGRIAIDSDLRKSSLAKWVQIVLP